MDRNQISLMRRPRQSCAALDLHNEIMNYRVTHRAMLARGSERHIDFERFNFTRAHDLYRYSSKGHVIQQNHTRKRHRETDCGLRDVATEMDCHFLKPNCSHYTGTSAGRTSWVFWESQTPETFPYPFSLAVTVRVHNDPGGWLFSFIPVVLSTPGSFCSNALHVKPVCI